MIGSDICLDGRELRLLRGNTSFRGIFTTFFSQCKECILKNYLVLVQSYKNKHLDTKDLFYFTRLPRLLNRCYAAFLLYPYGPPCVSTSAIIVIQRKTEILAQQFLLEKVLVVAGYRSRYVLLLRAR